MPERFWNTCGRIGWRYKNERITSQTVTSRKADGQHPHRHYCSSLAAHCTDCDSLPSESVSNVSLSLVDLATTRQASAGHLFRQPYLARIFCDSHFACLGSKGGSDELVRAQEVAQVVPKCTSFRSFAGDREFNPMVMVFRPLRLVKHFRFWEPFKRLKHGDPNGVDNMRLALFHLLDLPTVSNPR